MSRFPHAAPARAAATVALVGVLLATAPSAAQDVPSSDDALLTGDGETLPAACRPGRWELGGADWRVRDETSFNPDWIPPLQDIAACLGHPRMGLACVEIQGRFDERQFGKDIIRTFGSQRAAQQARAHARASRVISELVKMGVASYRLREVEPPTHSLFRGAMLELIADCAPEEPPAQEAVTREQLQEVVRATVEEEVAETTPAADEIVTREEVEEVVETVMRRAREGRAAATPEPSPQHLTLDAGLALTLLGSDVNAVFAPLLYAGAGWSNELLYVRLDVGFQIGSEQEHRFGIDVSGSAGYVFQSWPWLEVGLVAGDRFSAPAGDAPWLEQTWYAGVESSQCLFELWEGNRTCIQETLAPVGFRIRRGVVEDDRMRRIPTTQSPMVRFDVSVVTHHDLL